jgi:hypothetical protein
MRAGRRRPLAALAALCALAILAPIASAAAPTVGAVWTSNVQPTTARFNAEVDPNGKSSTYHFDYITKAAYDANVAGAKDPFTGTQRLPALADTIIPGTAATTIGPTLFGLTPDTAYRYRLVIKNADGTTTGPTRDLRTHSSAPFALPDNRGWELVSPVEKNGGEVEPPGALAKGGVLQAAADGQSVTYGSAASFAAGAGGAAVASQYLSSRVPGGWSTLNVTPPLLSGSYGTDPAGVPYQLFSPDLSRGLMLNGRPCRGEASGCPVANPPLAGTDAPSGYQNYYLREGATGAFEALLGGADVAELETDPADFELSFVGASSDLKAVVLSSCAALTANATDGCGSADPNLYLWSAGSIALINTVPGAALAAQSAAVSGDGTRIYFNDLTGGDLYLRQGVQTKGVDDDAPGGGGAAFQTATSDGSIAFYLKAGHLFRYEAATDSSTDLTPSGGVLGVLGASAGASHVYYLTASGLFLRQGASTTKVADTADAANYPPATGTARVSADGTKLLFTSTAPLTGYDNLNAATKVPESQVYLYDSTGAGTLTCVSCSPTHARPIGSSSIPGAVANGTFPGSTHTYKPRVLSSDGKRVFFDSEDAMVGTDVNLGTDLYQWEAQGKGTCSKPGGCISMISSGLANWGTFIDASATGEDVFFITDRSLVGADPGSVDLYDARVGGGFPEPVDPSPCIGDACQVVPPAVEDPVLTTVLVGPGNPKEQYRSYGAKAKCPKGKVRKKGKCVRKAKRKGGRR